MINIYKIKNNTFTTLALFILVGAVGFLLGRTTCSSNCSDGKSFECITSKVFSIGGSEDLNIDIDSLMDAAIQEAEDGITEDIKVINGDTIKTKMIIKRIEV